MTNERIEQAIALLSTKHEPVELETLIGMALEGKRPHGYAVMLTAFVAARRVAELEAVIDEQRAAAEAQVARVVGDWQASDVEASNQIAGLTIQVQNLNGQLDPWRPWAVSLIHHEEAPASAYLDGTTDEDLRRLVAGELARRVRAANELIASLPPGSTTLSEIDRYGDANDDEGTQWIVHVWTSEPPPDGDARLLPWAYRMEMDGETVEQGRAATWGDVFDGLGGTLETHFDEGDECVIVFGEPADMVADDEGERFVADDEQRRAWHEQYAHPETLRDLLGLVLHPAPTLEGILERTQDERNEAAVWAALEHLGAADNLVERVPMPAWLRDAPREAMAEGEIVPAKPQPEPV